MPSNKTHRQLSRAFGGSTDWVDAWKDRPSKVLGKGHRVLFHDHLTNAMLAAQSGNVNAFLRGEYHDYVDRSTTALKLQLLKSGVPRELVERMFE